MNKTYYKGNISLLSENRLIKIYNIGKYDKRKLDFVKSYNDAFSVKETKDMETILDSLLEKERKNITGLYPKLYEKKKKNLSFTPHYNSEIVFEKILDEDGKCYGKELYTGLIFPLFDLSNKKVVNINEEIYYSSKKDNTFFPEYDIEYVITLNINFDKMDKCDAIISDYEVADINEVNDYLGVKKHKRKLKKEINRISQLAYKNVYNSEIVPMHKEEIKREKQDEMTIIMENIEFLLEKLGTIDSNLKDKYEKKYELLLNSEEELLTNNPLTKISLIRLEGEIEYAISYSRSSSSDIVSYLENLKKEYLNNFISNNGNKTDITLQEIDKLNELFLKMKSSYNLKVQREVIRNISFIYLMEVYENIGIISKEELEESYFIDNKKSIIIAIESLIRMGLIEDNIIIDYNSDFSAEEMLNIISNIKFKQNTENKGTTRILEKIKNVNLCQSTCI